MLSDIYKKVAAELGLDLDVVKVAYLSQWKFIKEHIEVLPLKQDISEKEFKELRTSFNLPSLGKFYTTYEKVEKIKRRINYLKKIIDNDKT